MTFSCYQRRPLLNERDAKQTVELALDRVRRCYRILVYAYVIMPEHVHLLISEPERETLAVTIKSLKQGVSRKLISDAHRFWHTRYFDFNIRDHEQFMEKLRYIHRNPVTRGLCKHPQDWEWSSFRQYATGCEGRVRLESEWVATKQQRAAGLLPPAIKLPHSSR